MHIDDFHPLVLWCGLAQHNADWNWNNVCSPFARIYYVVSGKATVTMNDNTYILKPKHLYLIPPFVTHTTSCSQSFVHYYIHMYEDGMNEEGIFDSYTFPVEVQALENDELLFARLADINPAMRLPESNPVSYDNRNMINDSIIRNKQRTQSLQFESRGIVMQLLSRFLRNAVPTMPERDERIKLAMQYVVSHLGESLTVGQLANNVCLTSEHFIRLFSKSVGYTPQQYINMKRMERARFLLVTTDMEIKNIAYSLGFTDSSYFIRVFKQSVGVTPIEFRKGCSNSQDTIVP